MRLEEQGILSLLSPFFALLIAVILVPILVKKKKFDPKIHCPFGHECTFRDRPYCNWDCGMRLKELWD